MHAETDDRTLVVTEPDGMSRVLDLHDPQEDGNGLSGDIQLARGRKGGGEQIRGPAAYSPRPIDGLALDPQAVFRTEEPRIVLGRGCGCGCGDDITLRDEIARNGGRLPASVVARLTPRARAAPRPAEPDDSPPPGHRDRPVAVRRSPASTPLRAAAEHSPHGRRRRFPNENSAEEHGR
ncbi:hypothetical protein [Streptomyces tsukubensis]|uniref:Uncharacterized protein n=1 Tax=Streptomyces tsukubensis TaxID=83656 RepID=A0A1V3ZZC7_9ACTN|nr:hypothetical protein [Streptomyces tsukubensis]OON71821.1 hypothetical protein B1H18_32120 [Streptomyces tsukubensis]